ncbi:hypothetical protein DPMN_184214 [Dreissena polymorpha]|uniref:Uncharacterized protein n=1 Tax=Dreissena polymorpha TaxID=45954 RepID=A0A9D4I754_DREPO|nr:hypothetical protein DPMN_184214 [Dreissena polymorpha]
MADGKEAVKQISVKDKVKLPEKKKVQSKPVSETLDTSKCQESANQDSPNVEMLAILKSMQDSIIKQSEKMTDLGARLEKVESHNFDTYDDCYGYYEEGELFESDYIEEIQPVRHGSETKNLRKRPADEASHSRFEWMAKKIRPMETVDKDIDQTLADNINDLFHNGIDDDRYDELIKDEKLARPGNCEGLSVVKTNRLIWDAISHNAIGCQTKNFNTSKYQ